MIDSRCSSAAYKKKREIDIGRYDDLIRPEPCIIHKITAHPPYFAKFLTFVSCEYLEGTRTWFVWVDESIGVVHFFVRGEVVVGVEGGAC